MSEDKIEVNLEEKKVTVDYTKDKENPRTEVYEMGRIFAKRTTVPVSAKEAQETNDNYTEKILLKIGVDPKILDEIYQTKLRSIYDK